MYVAKQTNLSEWWYTTYLLGNFIHICKIVLILPQKRRSTMILCARAQQINQ